MAIEVKEIVTKWLKENHYDGLYNGYECGCMVSDLMPCNDYCKQCEAATKTDCTNCVNRETCHEGTHYFHPWTMVSGHGRCSEYERGDDEDDGE